MGPYEDDNNWQVEEWEKGYNMTEEEYNSRNNTDDSSDTRWDYP